MKIINPVVTIHMDKSGKDMLMGIERAGRVCYKSEDKISPGSAITFVQSILDRKHFSVLEHEKITVTVVTNRGVSHEIVRHRIASYSQESTRYCNYSAAQFGFELTFIYPSFWNPEDSDADGCKYALWERTMRFAETAYFELLKLGAKPQEARDVLPNALKTEIVITMNLREWRHFFYLRTSPKAHPQMQEVAKMILAEFRSRIPVIFDNIETEEQNTEEEQRAKDAAGVLALAAAIDRSS